VMATAVRSSSRSHSKAGEVLGRLQFGK